MFFKLDFLMVQDPALSKEHAYPVKKLNEIFPKAQLSVSRTPSVSKMLSSEVINNVIYPVV